MALAIAITIACLCLPLGYFEPKGMGLNAEMFNLWIKHPEGGVSMTSSYMLGIATILSTPTSPFAFLSLPSFFIGWHAGAYLPMKNW